MTLLLLHGAATLALVGLIWTIQVVHYPLMDRVAAPSFVRYHGSHTRRIGLIVAPLMLTEFVTSALIVLAPPAGVSAAASWIGLILVGVVWAATAGFAVPAHRRLAAGFDAAAHGQLVRTNWIRTLSWSARGILAIWMLAAHTG